MSEPARDGQLRSLAKLVLERQTSHAAWVEVAGVSMLPLIHAGDSLFVEFASGPYRIGEVLVFSEHGKMVVHRLVGRMRQGGEELLLTRGDGVVRLDAPFPSERVLGVVRGCKRASDGAYVTVLDGGIRGATVAMTARLGASMVAATTRFQSGRARPVYGLAWRFATLSISLLARSLARSTASIGPPVALPEPSAET